MRQFRRSRLPLFVDKRLPDACEKLRITVAGGETFGIFRSDILLGRIAWQRLIKTKFGERFQKWEYAACRTLECVPGGLERSTRCTYSAFACSPEVNTTTLKAMRIKEDGNLDLNRDDIMELQRLLVLLDHPIPIDGTWSQDTIKALIAWQIKTGVTTPKVVEKKMKTLQMLRRAAYPI